MKIGIIDADLIDGKTRHPNLALMKISKYFKDKNNQVELLLSYNQIKDYDLIFLSRVFTFTYVPKEVIEIKKVKYGGTGFCPDGDELHNLPYEIEHLCSKKYMSKMIQGFDLEGLPISSFANLCLLKKELNNAKGEKTIYEYYKGKDNETEKIKELEDKYTFTQSDYFKFLEYDNAKDFKAGYEEFLKNRWQILQPKLKDAFDRL
ncbi:MAG: hypothetical protein LBR40_00055 [Bacilli bacterium]|nr:hypothetical protein [Bacilli bacterium]